MPEEMCETMLTAVRYLISAYGSGKASTVNASFELFNLILYLRRHAPTGIVLK